MNKININPLNPITIPLQGSKLIEASAGTGKTFTISLLYLRLILGLKNENAYYKILSIEEILVVTFTEIATIELRNRILNDIRQLRLSCIRGRSDNPMHQLLIEQIDDINQAIEILLFAENNICNAAIYTIHGFCRKVLKFFNYELNILFQNKILSDEYTLFKKITLDFWHRRCFLMSLDVARIISNEWNSAEDFISTLYPLFQKKMQFIDFSSCFNENLELKHVKNISDIISIKNMWIMFHKDIFQIINSMKINKRIYSNKNLTNWINKITTWSKSETLDYQIPKELTRFRYSVIEIHQTGVINTFKLFEEIEKFLVKHLSLRDTFIKQAIIEITDSINKEKYLQGLLSFDDLLYYLDKALKQPNGDYLAENIRNNFPVLLIDEFQDIDPQQYRIFHKIYINQPNQAIIIIGDPKQAIYSFRGADISTYLNMRYEINDIYTLQTNWRSSSEMIESVNCLFSQTNLPFIYPEIPFIPIKSAINNKQLKFIFNKKNYPSLRFWVHPRDRISLIDYKYDMAKQCAIEINNWLIASKQQQAFLRRYDEFHILQASDITILVRNRSEANLIRNALNAFYISSVYLSDTDSVYNTVEARELLYLLKAIHYPTKLKLLRTALATSIFSINSKDIDTITSDNSKKINLIDKFSKWKEIWQKYGILTMLRTILSKDSIAVNILASKNGKRRLTNLMHIGELLQVEYTSLIGPNDLLNFFSKQILKQDNQIIDQQIRLEDLNVIRIITIHKSKGLEYPLVWIPFATGFGEYSNMPYYKDNILSCNSNVNNLIKINKERFSEELRLFYVAVTRAVYHCSIGIATFIKNSNKKENSNNLYKSVLGYLLQCNKNINLQTLKNCINKLNGIDINYIDINEKQNKNNKSQKQVKINTALNILKINRILYDSWLITNYLNIENKNDMNIFDISSKKDLSLTNNEFPYTLKFNKFIIDLLKSIDFNKLNQKEWLKYQLNINGYSLNLLKPIYKWLKIILYKKLDSKGLNLIAIKNINYVEDMKFFIPIRNTSVISDLSVLLDSKNILFIQENQFSCNEVKGIIRGYIDLVFMWKNKYYLLYYKIDRLKNYYCRNICSLKNKSFHLQYQLCTLAFHRYLKLRVKNYSYERYFGGVFYLFLRNINENSNNGIMNVLPNRHLIEKLDQFIGKKP
ncbi:exodeoxyribonuclease V subunit beta [Candidatus Pantoea edessiphila]|uniref:RecBCD enzyme subunit RecB n=1 Tax=Candidatus Pantoea edessiphila TaxID=2044610 RepID=A0A2P5SZP0_9GAMM|nr:exodeoxyribonuclease V subunit beta [Candidatus Pantoea edessiphila]PPI87770.1 exodeoxyribonuclease V subunit beta [Candidatus Pantoea edessiphila]